MTISVVPPTEASPAEPLLREVIGDVLRRARGARGLTLRDVARDSTVSLAYLSEIERGQKEPSSEVLAAVCKALGIRMLDLVSAAQHGLVAHELATEAGRIRGLRVPSRVNGTVALAA